MKPDSMPCPPKQPSLVGRSSERKRIADLWQAIPVVGKMQAMLVTGETGIGKSRLMAEVAADVRAVNGSVLHMKVTADRGTSIIALLSEALQAIPSLPIRSDTILQESVPSVATRLRNMVRLRMLMVIVEDVHLAGEEAFREFSALLRAISGELIAVVVVTPVAEQQVRSILEPYMVDELCLGPLSKEESIAMWKQTLGEQLPDEYMQQFLITTRGVPFAILSAIQAFTTLRTLSLPSNVKQLPELGELYPLPSIESFRTALAKIVQKLALGFDDQLLEREKEGAALLAVLGEVFARETAQHMLNGEAELLDALIAKGIIIESRLNCSVVSGEPNRFPVFGFAHTLLYEHYIANANDFRDIATTRLIEAIVTSQPLYSMGPFLWFETFTGDGSGLSDENVYKVLESMMEISNKLDITADWELGLKIWERASELGGGYIRDKKNGSFPKLQALLLRYEIYTEQRNGFTESKRLAATQLYAITEGHTSSRMILYRVLACSELCLFESLDRQKLAMNRWQEVERIVEEYPELRVSSEYVEHLSNIGILRSMNRVVGIRKHLHDAMHKVLNEPGCTEYLQAKVYASVAPHLLQGVNSEADIAERLVLLRRIEANIAGSYNVMYLQTKTNFLMDIGCFDELLEAIDIWEPILSDCHADKLLAVAQLKRQLVLAILGKDLSGVEKEVVRILKGIYSTTDEYERGVAATYVREIGIYTNSPGWAYNVIHTLYHNPAYIGHLSELRYMDLAAGVGIDQIEGILENALAIPSFVPIIQQIRSGIAGGAAEKEKIAEALRTFLTYPVLSVRRYLQFDFMMMLLEIYEGKFPGEVLRVTLAEPITDAIQALLVWMEEKGLQTLMLTTIEHYAGYLPDSSCTKWQKRYNIVAKKHTATLHNADSGGDTVAISMIGTIGIGIGPNEINRLRGGRLRIVLGLLVINEMLETPLSFQEFCMLALDTTTNSDLERRNLNVIIFRLREFLGAKVVTTDHGDTPKLHIGMCHVDILKLHTVMKDIELAVQKGMYNVAINHLHMVLDALGNNGILPGLSGAFFKAAREDFRQRVFNAVTIVARWFMLEHDIETAGTLLYKGCKTFPERYELRKMLMETGAHDWQVEPAKEVGFMNGSTMHTRKTGTHS